MIKEGILLSCKIIHTGVPKLWQSAKCLYSVSVLFVNFPPKGIAYICYCEVQYDDNYRYIKNPWLTVT